VRRRTPARCHAFARSGARLRPRADRAAARTRARPRTGRSALSGTGERRSAALPGTGCAQLPGARLAGKGAALAPRTAASQRCAARRRCAERLSSGRWAIVGLAVEVCACATVLDALKKGFEVHFIRTRRCCHVRRGRADAARCAGRVLAYKRALEALMSEYALGCYTAALKTTGIHTESPRA